MTIISINARPADIDIKAKIWETVAAGTVVATTSSRSYKAESDMRLVRIEQGDHRTDLVFLDHAKLFAVVQIPIDLVDTGLFAAKLTLRFGSSTFPATVEQLDYVVRNNALEAVLSYEDPDMELYPGLRLLAILLVDKREDVLAVPRRHVELTPDGRHRVRTVLDNEVDIREVEIGLIGKYFVEVVSGLSEGELVIAPEQSSLAGDNY